MTHSGEQYLEQAEFNTPIKSVTQYHTIRPISAPDSMYYSFSKILLHNANDGIQKGATQKGNLVAQPFTSSIAVFIVPICSLMKNQAGRL